ENWTTLIAEDTKDVLEWASCVNNDTLVLCYLHDVKNVLYLHRLADGSLIKELPLDIGSIVGFSGKKKQTEIFYQFTSFLTPGVIFHYDLAFQDSAPK
ncbi:prolyl endopeptidase, partial [Paramuricea clavata]